MTTLSVYGLDATIVPQSKALAHDCRTHVLFGQDSQFKKLFTRLTNDTQVTAQHKFELFLQDFHYLLAYLQLPFLSRSHFLCSQISGMV